MLKLPLVAWLGIATFISLVITLSFGLAMHKFNKDVFKFHRFFALLTIILAIIHILFAILFLLGVYVR